MDLAPNTVRAYRADWAHFEGWCRGQRRRALPASATTVAVYVAELAETRKGLHRPAPGLRHCRCPPRRYRSQPPTRNVGVRVAALRIERDQRARFRPTAPLTVDDLEAMSLAMPEGAAGARDRALGAARLRAGCDGRSSSPSTSATWKPPDGVCACASEDARSCCRSARGRAVCGDGMADVDTRRRSRARTVVPSPSTGTVTWGHAASATEPSPSCVKAPRHVRVSTRRGTRATRCDAVSCSRRPERGAPERGIMAQTGHRTRRLVRDDMRDGTT